MLCVPNNHKVWITHDSKWFRLFIMNHISECVNYGHVWWCLMLGNQRWQSWWGRFGSLTPYRPPPVLLVKCHSQLLVLFLSWKGTGGDLFFLSCGSHNVSIHGPFHWMLPMAFNIKFGMGQHWTDFLFNIFNVCNVSWHTSNPSRSLILQFHTRCGLQNSWLHPGPRHGIQTTCQVGCQHGWRRISRIY